MDDYHNAVSDKLVVSFFGSNVVYAVYNKHNTLKQTWIKSLGEDLPIELEASIFSATSAIISNSNFILLPLSEDQESASFLLSYSNVGSCFKTVVDDIKVVYEIPEDCKPLLAKLINATTESDIGISISYFRKKGLRNALFFYEVNQVLTILAIKEGELVLANRYPVSSDDELFYFIMLVVEQLELPTDSVYVECSSTKGEHENLQALFKNYLPNLNLTSVNLEAISAENKSEQNLAKFFSQCVL